MNRGVPSASRTTVLSRKWLMRGVIGLILATSAAVMTISLRGAYRAVDRLCQNLIEQTTERTHTVKKADWGERTHWLQWDREEHRSSLQKEPDAEPTPDANLLTVQLREQGS